MAVHHFDSWAWHRVCGCHGEYLIRHNINVNDFYKERLTQKEVQQVITDILFAYTINLDILDELDEGRIAEDDDDLAINKTSKAFDYYSDKLGDYTPLLLYATAFEILAKMYKFWLWHCN